MYPAEHLRHDVEVQRVHLISKFVQLVKFWEHAKVTIRAKIATWKRGKFILLFIRINNLIL